MLWACLDEQMVELTLPFLGEERATWQYPFGDLRARRRPPGRGQRLAGQHPEPARGDPRRGQPDGVRRGRAGRHDRFLPEQAIALESAFAAYTSGSAWINHRDDAGVLRPGATADLVVLDRDPFAGSAADIGGTRVVSTWIDGTAVHRR